MTDKLTKEIEALSSECNHVVGYRHTFHDARLVDIVEMRNNFEPSIFFTYCPWCGVKL